MFSSWNCANHCSGSSGRSVTLRCLRRFIRYLVNHFRALPGSCLDHLCPVVKGTSTELQRIHVGVVSSYLRIIIFRYILHQVRLQVPTPNPSGIQTCHPVTSVLCYRPLARCPCNRIDDHGGSPSTVGWCGVSGGNGLPVHLPGIW